MADRETRVWTKGLKRWAVLVLGLRLVSGLWLAWVGSLRPFTPLEQRVGLWPLHAPFLEWLARTFLAPWQRWDVGYYLRIVTQGYAATDGTAQFHPLYPWLAWPWVRLGMDPLLALLLVSTVAAVVFLAALDVWLSERLGASSAQRVVRAFVFSPLMAFLLFPYTEPLFLTLAVLTLLALQRGRWAWAGLGAALATFTRQQGVLLLVPIAWTLWTRRRELRWRAWWSLLGAPLAWVGWVLYRALALGDWQPGLGSFQELVYSVLISRSHEKVVPEQAFLWPWEALRRAVGQMLAAPDVDMGLNAALAVGMVALLILAWRRLTGAEKGYALAVIGVSFAYYTGQVHPYMGLPRHMALAFPLVLGMERLTRRPWQRVVWSVVGALGLLLVVAVYGLRAWVP